MTKHYMCYFLTVINSLNDVMCVKGKDFGCHAVDILLGYFSVKEKEPRERNRK